MVYSIVYWQCRDDLRFVFVLLNVLAVLAAGSACGELVIDGFDS